MLWYESFDEKVKEAFLRSSAGTDISAKLIDEVE